MLKTHHQLAVRTEARVPLLDGVHRDVAAISRRLPGLLSLCTILQPRVEDLERLNLVHQLHDLVY